MKQVILGKRRLFLLKLGEALNVERVVETARLLRLLRHNVCINMQTFTRTRDILRFVNILHHTFSESS